MTLLERFCTRNSGLRIQDGLMGLWAHRLTSLLIVSCVLCLPVAVAEPLLDTGHWIPAFRLSGFLAFSLELQGFASAESTSRPVEPRSLEPQGFEMGAIPSSSTEVQSYVALCKAIYWERMGYQATYERDRIGSYRKAKEQLMSAIQLTPRSSFLYAKLAEVLIILKELGTARYACEKSLELNPYNADAHYLLGLLKFARRDRQGAISEFRTVAELEPEHIGAQQRLASLLFEDEDYSGAALAYSEMVKLRPYDPKLRNRLGISYSGSGETAKAIEEFKAAVKLRKDYLEPHFHLAYLYAHQSRNKEAIEECLIVLESSPEDPKTNLLLAELYVSIAEFDKAIPGVKRILKQQRKVDKDVFAEAHYRLATAYKGKKETSLADLHFQRSIEIYEEILDKDPGNIGIDYEISEVYYARGDRLSLQLAEKHLRRHIELRPDEPDAYNFLGYMFTENDMNLEEAVALIKKAVAIEPRNGVFRDSLGWAYFKLGKLDEATTELEKAVELIPDDSEVREHLGEAYLKMGRGDSAGRPYIEKAVLEWEKALEVKPKNASLQQRLEELRRSLGADQETKEKG